MANSLDTKCVGTITRRRNTLVSVEESIIVHLIISAEIEKDLESLVIDEKGDYSLQKYSKTASVSLINDFEY